ncbi:phage tail tip lysozyme [Cupriavidus pampae]|uniref:Phage tail lysozyme domain-containing protein n=1 Tax=Cupriavidus pampae TaxID=659251 RepID=A0ABN7YX54_9BURK|nr:phage tail tip lysozyme [Cupriavidus pampae]CAG9177863.1 hypothetical protein LMG32289_03930 [Cupriavidus pampae]
MANNDNIRELLVGLGFKVDETGLKNFDEGVERAAKGVTQLVTTIGASARSVSAGVSALASKLEEIYFVAQRTGATATSLKAFDFAARNLGISSETAFGAVESLAKYLRSNPAGERYLATLGVQTRNANGELRDTADILADVGKELANKPTLSGKYGEALGIDPNLLLAMRSGEFARFMQQYRDMSRNSGLDQAAEDSHRFMVQMRELGATFESFGIKVEGALLRKVGPLLEQFQGWVDEHGDEIAGRVADIASAILTAAETLGPPLRWVADQFIELDRVTDGWSTKILLLVSAFGALGGFKIVGGLWDMVKAVRALFAANAAAAAGGAAAGAGGAAGAAGAGAAGAGAAGAGAASAGAARAGAVAGRMSRFLPWLGRFAGAAGLGLYSSDLNTGEEAELARRRAAAGAEQRPAGAYGAAQWNPDRQANFKAWSGKDIRDSSLTEQLQFVHYELTQGADQRAGQLLRAAQNAQQAGEIVSRYYERPAQADAEAARRGASAVSLQQETNINVYGVSDPAAAGRAAADSQAQVNGDMVRNFQGAIA